MQTKIQISITATGDRGSGKTTVLKIAKDALIAAGFEVSNIGTFGEGVIKEHIVVTTAITTTQTKWLVWQP
jgi:nucleoside-triphosphatase THEP1